VFNYSEIKINNFSGGMTDRYIDGTSTTSEKISNLNITKFGTLKIREGYRWYLSRSDYAHANDTVYMGLLRLSDLDNVVMSQAAKFYIVNDEVTLTFSPITHVEVNPDILLTTVVPPIIEVVIDDSSIQALLSEGKVPVADTTAFEVGKGVYITYSDETTYRSDGIDTILYVKSIESGTTPKTITLIHTLGETVGMNLSSNGSNVIVGDKIRSTSANENGWAADKLYVSNNGGLTVGDAINITNSNNTDIRTDGTDFTFYVGEVGADVSGVDGATVTGEYIKVKAQADSVSALSLTDKEMSAQDNVYAEGGAKEREPAYGFIKDSTNVITLPSPHGLTTGDQIYFDQINSKVIGLSEKREYFFRTITTTTGTIHLIHSDAVANENIVELTPITYYGDVLLIKKASATEILPPSEGSLLKSSTLQNNQHISFSEWQDQLLVTSESSSTTVLSRPGRIYYGSEPIIVKQSGSSDTVTATNHGLANGDTVDFITIFGSTPSGLTDNTTYYVRDVAANTFKIEASAGSGAITVTFADEVNQFTPLTKVWKSHSLGLPKPGIHTNGSIVDTNMAVTTGTGSGKTYKYAATYKYIYNSNGVEYTTYGPVKDLDGSGTAYKYTTENAINAIYGTIITDVDGGSTLASGIIGVDSEAGFTVGDEIKITSNSEAALRNEGVSLFVIAKAAGTITVSDESGGDALDLTSNPNWAIVNGDEIYPKASVTITVPCLRTPATGSPYLEAEWNFDRIVIELYRTKENGTTYYYVGETQNDKDSSTTTISDDKSDAAIGAEKSLYTTGGGADFHPAPPCKYIINLRDTAYFCNVTEEVESTSGSKMFTYQHPARVYQSIPGISGSMGDVFYVDLDDDIVGIGEVGGLPIVFTDSYIYRLEGRIDLLGSGDIRARVIDENVGCSSHRSIVKTPRGLFWAGKHGFYQTDGYKIVNITENLDDSFRSITATNAVRKLISGTYDEKEGRIFWGVCSGANLTEPDMLWVLWTRFMAFTTIEGGDIDASSLLVRDADLYRGDKYGSILKHSNDYGHDTHTVIGENMAPASVFLWNDVPIHFEYRSNAMSFGRPSMRKWVNETSISLETSGNMCILPGSANDGETATSGMKEIKRISSLTWNDPDFIWGSSDLVWNAPDVITAVRRFPRKEQRCRRKQVRLEPAKFIKYVSDNWYEAYISQDPESTTKVKAVSTKWPGDLSEADICFPGDYVAGKFNYSATGSETKCISILSRNSDTEIDFYPGSFTGWEQTSAGQFMEFGEDSSNGYISIPDLWKWDFSLNTTSVAGSSAARETGIIGLTKDWTLSYWVKADVSDGNRGSINHMQLSPYGQNATSKVRIDMENNYHTFTIYTPNLASDSLGYSLSTTNYRTDYWATTASATNLIGDGETWNHIVLTHKGTARQTDDRKFGSALFTASSKAVVDSTKSTHNLTNGIIGVDDTSVFTVGECINITNTEGTVTRIHNSTYTAKDSDYARPHTFYVQAKSDTIGGNSTITLAEKDNTNPAWLTKKPYAEPGGVTGDGSDGKIRITRAEFLDVGDIVSIVLWNRITDAAIRKLDFPNHLTGSEAGPEGTGGFNGGYVEDFYIIAKTYDLTVDACVLTLSATEGGTAFDLRGPWISGSAFAEVISASNSDYPKLYLSNSIDVTGAPLALVAADLSTSGIDGGSPITTATGIGEADGDIPVDNSALAGLEVGKAINITKSDNSVIRSDGTDKIFYVIALPTSTTVRVSATLSGLALDISSIVEDGDKIYKNGDVNLTTGEHLMGDKIYVEHSVHEPNFIHLTGGIYDTDNTPGWTMYVNGAVKTTTAGDGRSVVDIPNLMEWTRNISGDTYSDVVQMFGEEAAVSGSQGPEGMGINNITWWNSFKSESEVSEMYNANIQKDFEDGDCKVQINFNDSSDGELIIGELTNSGANPNIIPRFQQGAHNGDNITTTSASGQIDGSVLVGHASSTDMMVGEPIVITNPSGLTVVAHGTGKVFYIISREESPAKITLSNTLGGEAIDLSSIVGSGDRIYRSIDINTETGSVITNNPAKWSIKNNKIKWSIRKHQLDQEIELKEIDVKFGIMDNVEGRYGKEVEKSNE
jgi:hypothetical protein